MALLESLCKTDEDIIVQDSALISLASLACLQLIFLFSHINNVLLVMIRGFLLVSYVSALQCRVPPKESMRPADLMAIGL